MCRCRKIQEVLFPTRLEFSAVKQLWIFLLLAPLHFIIILNYIFSLFPNTAIKPGTLLPPYPYCDFTAQLCERKCCPPPEQEDAPQTLPVNPGYHICKYCLLQEENFFYQCGLLFPHIHLVTQLLHSVRGTVVPLQCPLMKKWPQV